MTKKMKSKIFALFLGLISTAAVSAQMLPSTAYFMDKNPLRHTMNPSFSPMEKITVSIPGMSLMKFGVGNNALTFKDVYQPKMVDGKNTTVLFLHPEWTDGRQQFLDQVKRGLNIGADVNVQLLSFGMRVRPNSFASFAINTRTDVQTYMPKAFFESVLDGELRGDNTVQKMDFSNLFVGVNAYTELAFGYAYDYNEKWSFGAKLKFLIGHAAIKTDFSDVGLTMSKDRWELSGDADLYVSAPGLNVSANEDGTIDDVEFESDGLSASSGKGFAVDFGATYKFSDNITLSASVLDLGGVKYRKNVHSFSKDGDFVFEGLEYDINDDKDFDEYFDQYGDMLSDMYHVNSKSSSFGYRTAPKILIGGEYGIWENKTTFGLLSKTRFDYSKVSEELMLSANFKPWRIFSMSLSYSLLDGHWSNLGAGMNLNLGAFNWFMVLDQVPLRYAKGESLSIPLRTSHMNFAMGFNIAVRDKADRRSGRKAETEVTAVQVVE